MKQLKLMILLLLLALNFVSCSKANAQNSNNHKAETSLEEKSYEYQILPPPKEGVDYDVDFSSLVELIDNELLPDLVILDEYDIDPGVGITFNNTVGFKSIPMTARERETVKDYVVTVMQDNTVRFIMPSFVYKDTYMFHEDPNLKIFKNYFHPYIREDTLRFPYNYRTPKYFFLSGTGWTINYGDPFPSEYSSYTNEYCLDELNKIALSSLDDANAAYFKIFRPEMDGLLYRNKIWLEGLIEVLEKYGAKK
jgi:hypothetical protein